MRVGVKFCGNCNPLVDMGAVLQELRAQASDVEFVHWNSERYDILLILSGCSRDCATRPDFDGQVIEATDASVDRWPVAATELTDAILSALRGHADHERSPGQAAPHLRARQGSV